jgi:hypothetical protein
VEDRIEVDGEHFAPVGAPVLGCRRSPDRAGVVDEDVETAERRRRLVDGVGKRRCGCRGEVAMDAMDTAPECLDPRRGLARITTVEEGDIGPRLGERYGRSLAEPLAGAGDECDLPVEAETVEDHAVPP